jgi:hypothetical protein
MIGGLFPVPSPINVLEPRHSWQAACVAFTISGGWHVCDMRSQTISATFTLIGHGAQDA